LVFLLLDLFNLANKATSSIFNSIIPQINTAAIKTNVHKVHSGKETFCLSTHTNGSFRYDRVVDWYVLRFVQQGHGLASIFKPVPFI